MSGVRDELAARVDGVGVSRRADPCPVDGLGDEDQVDLGDHDASSGPPSATAIVMCGCEPRWK